MFPARRVAVFVVLSLASPILLAPLLAGERASPGGFAAGTADRPPQPEFKRESAAKTFAGGVKHFKNRAYGKARTDFKRVRSAATDRKNKRLVSLWIKAARGGQELVAFKKLVMSGRYRESYEDLTEVYAKYRGSPIEKEYVTLWKQLAPRVVTVIEGFDSHSAYYEKKPGRKYVQDSAQVLQGSHCLSWVGTPGGKPSTLELRRVPADWTQYDAVELWYNAQPGPRQMEFAIVCDSEDAHTHTARLRITGKGWQCLRLPLKKFSKMGTPCVNNVKRVELRVEGDRRFSLRLDCIALLRAPEQKAGRRR